MTTIQDVLAFVSTASSEDLNAIATTAAARRKVAAAVEASLALSAYGPGTRVRLKGALSPKYLVGLVGVVKNREGDKIVVDLDEWQYTGKFGNRSLRVPPQCVEAE